MPTRFLLKPCGRRAPRPIALAARSILARSILALSILGVALAIPGPVAAATAWVKDELKLNIRTGPGTQYRIIGAIGTGDQVNVIGHGDGWTQVRASVGQGWIPAGFLQDEPTAGERLAQSEAQTTEFRSQLETVSSRASELEAANSSLSERDATQKSQIETLTRENLELKAGARWPEWITGAGILAIGMLMGAILQGISGRRSRPRIRL